MLRFRISVLTMMYHWAEGGAIETRSCLFVLHLRRQNTSIFGSNVYGGIIKPLILSSLSS
jgi:hypothetical protein